MSTTEAPSAPATSSQPLPRRPPRPLETPALKYLRSRRTILASASPRRAALLGTLGLRPEIRPSGFAEDLDKTTLSPYEYVLETAKRKALDVYQTALEEGKGAFTTKHGVSATLANGAKAGDEQEELITTEKTAPSKDPDVIIAADTIIVGHAGQVLEKPRNEAHHIAMLRSLRDSGTSVPMDPAAMSGNVKEGPKDETAESLRAAVAEADRGLGGGVRGESRTLYGEMDAGDAEGGSKRTAVELANKGWHHVYTAVAVLMPLESARDPGYVLESFVEETGVKFDPTVTDDLIISYVRTREGADKAGGYGIQGMGGLLVEKIDGTFDNVVGMPLRATLALVEKCLARLSEDAEEDEEDTFGQFGERDLLR